MAVFKPRQLGLMVFAFLISCTVQAATPSNADPASPQVIPLVNTDQVEWTDVTSLPPGAKMAVLSGNPEKNEPFVVRIQFPANFIIPAHSHPINEYDTVLSGALYFGTGDKIDKDKAIMMPEQSFVMIPANVDHYSFTKEETEIQISGIGPWGMTMTKPASDSSPTDSSPTTAKSTHKSTS